MNVSLLATFAAGFMTFFSPCILPLAPILVAGLVSNRHTSRWARLRATAWFVSGFAAVFVVLGLTVPPLFQALRPLRGLLLGGSGAVLVFFGLHMTGILGGGERLGWVYRSFGPRVSHARPARAAGIFLFGAAFGLTWTPCAGPILGAVLTFTSIRETGIAESGTLLLAYAAGFALPLLALAAAAESARPVLAILRGQARRLELVTGLALVAFGLFTVSQISAATGGTSRAPEQLARLGQSDHERLVLFRSEQCPVCRALEHVLPAVARDCGADRLEIVRVDVDRAESAEVVARFAVRAVPTLALLDADGAERARLVGYQTDARLREVVAGHTRVACAKPDLRRAAPVNVEPGQSCTADTAC